MAGGPLPDSFGAMAREMDSLRQAIRVLADAVSRTGRHIPGTVSAGATIGSNVGSSIGGLAGGPSGASVGGAIGGIAGAFTGGQIGVAAAAIVTAFRVASTAVGVFSGTISEASSVLSRFSQYSLGGLHAQFQVQIGDLRRNLEVSRAISSEMQSFGKSLTTSRDAFQGIDTSFNKIILTLGTSFNNLVSRLAPAIEPFVKWLEKGVDTVVPFIDMFSARLGELTKGMGPLLSAFRDIGATVGDSLLKLGKPLQSLFTTVMSFSGNLLPILSPLVEIWKAMHSAIADMVPPILGLAEVLVKVAGIISKVVIISLYPAFELLASVAKAAAWALGKLVDAVEWVVNKLRLFAGLQAIDRKAESDQMAKMIEAIREGNLEARKKNIGGLSPAIVDARRAFLAGQMDRRAAINMGAINPFEAVLGQLGRFGLNPDNAAMRRVKGFRARVGPGGAAAQKRQQQGFLGGEIDRVRREIEAQERAAKRVPLGNLRDQRANEIAIKNLQEELKAIQERARAAGVDPDRIGFLNQRNNNIRQAMNDRVDVMSDKIART